MDETPINLATSKQLIDELMRRPTFVGVIVAVRADVTGDEPQDKRPVEVYGSQKRSVLLVARMLAQATEKVITKLAIRPRSTSTSRSPTSTAPPARVGYRLPNSS